MTHKAETKRNHVEQRRRDLLDIYAVLTTLQGFHPQPCVESAFYLAFDMDLERWTQCRSAILRSGFVSINHNLVTLTDAGLEVAGRLIAIGSEPASATSADT